MCGSWRSSSKQVKQVLALRQEGSREGAEDYCTGNTEPGTGTGTGTGTGPEPELPR